jgi:hypothetical protein
MSPLLKCLLLVGARLHVGVVGERLSVCLFLDQLISQQAITSMKNSLISKTQEDTKARISSKHVRYFKGSGVAVLEGNKNDNDDATG